MYSHRPVNHRPTMPPSHTRHVAMQVHVRHTYYIRTSTPWPQSGYTTYTGHTHTPLFILVENTVRDTEWGPVHTPFYFGGTFYQGNRVGSRSTPPPPPFYWGGGRKYLIKILNKMLIRPNWSTPSLPMPRVHTPQP